ncbi:hypothetical protein HU200_011817 [Digitaria exilis]|uniref:C2H2-type domain-containing protein n=1 Tax=Digitaria exilis TaxID=1010633 RepID=A0A835FHN5_9POAL|nr:hypothetical protein HU200_011817 [Digitaria exilis]
MIGGGGNPYFQQQQQFQQHGHAGLDGMDGGGGGGFMEAPASDSADAQCHALLYNLSVLRDKVQQLQPLVGLAVEHDGGAGPVAAVSSAGVVIQEIITAASSMMYAFQQLCSSSRHGGGGSGAHQSSSSTAAANAAQGAAAVGPAKNAAGGHGQAAVVVMDSHHHVIQQQQQQWQQQQHHHNNNIRGGGVYDDDNRIHTNNNNKVVGSMRRAAADEEEETPTPTSTAAIIELDASELLAKYTHYCQVCGKGFKRDANLRMHMRAHGDEYKSSAALANPAKNVIDAAAAASTSSTATTTNKSYYSCPQEGCRWNRKHAKFQPLKSVICAKNHYKRSHCPKMYVCNRCNRKHFSVLSDLRTHEKHCGDHRWLCSCGTSFSRKDKLIGHLTLFAGHHPAVPLLDRHNGAKRSSTRQQL